MTDPAKEELRELLTENIRTELTAQNVAQELGTEAGESG